MPETDQEMADAIAQWLAARADFFDHGRHHLAAYCAADSRLVAAFAADWAPGDPEMFATAYQEFRAAVAANAPSTAGFPTH